MKDNTPTGHSMIDPGIRHATLADLPALVDLFEAYREFYKMAADPDGAGRFLKELMEKNLSVIYVIANNEVLYGFVQLYPLFSSTRMQRLWLLNDLFVLQSSRGLGYSRRLIEVAKQHAFQSGACGLQLETQQDNSVANQLYRATGFERDAEHNFYFWPAGG